MFSQPSVMKTEVLSVNLLCPKIQIIIFFLLQNQTQAHRIVFHLYVGWWEKLYYVNINAVLWNLCIQCSHSIHSKMFHAKGSCHWKQHTSAFFSPTCFLSLCRLSNAGVHAIPLFFFTFLFFEKFSLRKMIILSRFLLISPFTLFLSLSFS